MPVSKKHFAMTVGYPGKEGTVCRNDVEGLGGCGKTIGKNEPCVTITGYNISFRQHVSCHLQWLEDAVKNAKPKERGKKDATTEAEPDGNP